MRPNPTRAWGPDPHSCPPAPPTLVHSALDDQALLGLMLRRAVQGPHGDPGKNTHRLAGALLERFSGLGAVVAAEPGELARAPGLDPVALSDLKLLRELAIRLARDETCRRPVITSWPMSGRRSRMSPANSSGPCFWTGATTCSVMSWSRTAQWITRLFTHAKSFAGPSSFRPPP